MTDLADRLASLLTEVVSGAAARPDGETLLAILAEGAKFARQVLAPFAPVGDRVGARFVNGEVLTAPGHVDVWRAYANAGWTALTISESDGGQALPMAVATAVQMLMDGVDPAFGMLAINARCAARLLSAHGDAATRAEWLPRLADGSWAATICISEAQAGSDVGRIRTRMHVDAEGVARVTGEKCWISYGGHDLASRIGHFVLARYPNGPAGTRGLSLFLVPDRDPAGAPNGVQVLRVEEKLGLHASPTCTLRFDAAAAIPLGPEGRGLPTLFTMVVAMRLAVAAQGAGVALAASELAERYAHDRLQGGSSAAAPLPIAAHADIRRLLLRARARAEAAALMALEAAACVDAAEAGDPVSEAEAALLLPVAKTFGAEAGFAVADIAIQVLGGAGYVREFPAERLLRDCRVFAIYEGTTAMQGQDLLLRRVVPDGGAVLRALLQRLKPRANLLAMLLDLTAVLVRQPVRLQEAACTPFLQLLGLVCADGLLRRASRMKGASGRRYAALEEVFATEAEGVGGALLAQCRVNVDDAFAAIWPDSMSGGVAA